MSESTSERSPGQAQGRRGEPVTPVTPPPSASFRCSTASGWLRVPRNHSQPVRPRLRDTRRPTLSVPLLVHHRVSGVRVQPSSTAGERSVERTVVEPGLRGTTGREASGQDRQGRRVFRGREGDRGGPERVLGGSLSRRGRDPRRRGVLDANTDPWDTLGANEYAQKRG